MTRVRFAPCGARRGAHRSLRSFMSASLRSSASSRGGPGGKMSNPMHVVWWSDGPVVPTGFGVVTKNIADSLFVRKVLDPATTYFYAINYIGDWSPNQQRYRLWPANVGLARDPDPYGRDRFCQMLL